MFKKISKWFGGNSDDDAIQSVGGIFGRMTPEALCEIEPDKMDRDQIRKQLANLYQRHNHAAGSLNPELRDEAEKMLKAIVHCREKYVDTASASA
tara:strand:+ start:1019 stop:1303 length:285 start_codon:yes stop_codon:yes gene_type:complete